MINRSTFVALAILAVTAAAARAQNIDSPYDFVETSQEVWAFGSAVLTDRGAINVGPGSSYAAGLGYTIRITGPFNFDARAAFMPTTRHVFDLVEGVDSATIREDPAAGLEKIGTADLSLLLFDASLRFDVTGPRTWHQLQPYALIGLGAALRFSSDNDAEEPLDADTDLFVRFQNGFTGHVGAGVEWYVSDRFSVRADARDLLWKVHVPEGFFVSGRVIDDEEWVQTAHLSLGVAFRF